MKRIATVMVLSLTLLAVGKFSQFDTHRRQPVAADDSGGDSGDDGDGDDDSGK